MRRMVSRQDVPVFPPAFHSKDSPSVLPCIQPRILPDTLHITQCRVIEGSISVGLLIRGPRNSSLDVCQVLRPSTYLESDMSPVMPTLTARGFRPLETPKSDPKISPGRTALILRARPSSAPRDSSRAKLSNIHRIGLSRSALHFQRYIQLLCVSTIIFPHHVENF